MNVVRLYTCPYFINGECSLRSHDNPLIDYWNNKYLVEGIIPHCPKGREYCRVDVDTDNWSGDALKLIRTLVNGCKRNGNGNAGEIVEIIEQILERQDDMKDASLESLIVSRKWSEKKQAEARQEGREEAWDLARRIVTYGPPDTYTNADLRPAFGSCSPNDIFNLPPDKAIEKDRAYQKEKNKLHVGDEVKFQSTNMLCGYVVKTGMSEYVTVLTKDRITSLLRISDLAKTGNVNEDLVEALSVFDE